MSEQSRLRIKLELMWWVFTAILVMAVLAPVYLNKLTYPFYVSNVLFIVIFVTVTRYIFLLKHTWLARMKWLKIGITVASVIVIFMLTMSLFDFNNYLDDVGLQELVAHLPADDQYYIMRYIQREVIFFGVGGIVAMIILPVRMLISLRRMRNTIT